VKVKYSDQAVSDLKCFNEVDRRFVAEKIHYLADNFKQLRQTKKVRELKGTKFPGQYRYTIARKIRAIFRLENENIVLLILRVGLRKNVY